jgi:multidrug efflux system outer membrane protein
MDANEEVRDRCAGRLPKCGASERRLVGAPRSSRHRRNLEVLTTDTDLYSAQLLLVQAQQREAFSIVQLYLALGGGWR